MDLSLVSLSFHRNIGAAFWTKHWIINANSLDVLDVFGKFEVSFLILQFYQISILNTQTWRCTTIIIFLMHQILYSWKWKMKSQCSSSWMATQTPAIMVPLPRVTDGWDMSNITLWSPPVTPLLYCAKTCVVQRRIVSNTTLWLHLIVGGQKDLSASTLQIEPEVSLKEEWLNHARCSKLFSSNSHSYLSPWVICPSTKHFHGV